MNAHIDAAKALLASAKARYAQDLEKVHKKLRHAVGQTPTLMGEAMAILRDEYVTEVPPIVLAPFEQPDADPGQELSLLAGDAVIAPNVDPGLTVDKGEFGDAGAWSSTGVATEENAK